MPVRSVPAIIHDRPHRRRNPLTGEWVLVSPHRTQRPWQGKVETTAASRLPEYDPNCYLCPGNSRASGAVNPPYSGVYVFDNDFSALLPATHPAAELEHPLLQQETVGGTCRVLCFSPRHDLTLALMDEADVLRVVDLWAGQAEELGRRYSWVQIFENRGEIMGCSNAHPHGQLWAGSALPNEPAKEDAHQRLYREERRSVLLLEYLELETGRQDLVVEENDYWAVLIPFWAVWPFETLLLPRRHVLRLPDLTAAERQSLAGILKRLLTRYDNLFRASFPYTMGWHGAPTTAGDFSHWQLHAHFYPPLLRSATVKKFMVGYEMLSEPQRDITSEAAAGRLRELPSAHFALDLEGKKK